MPKNSKLDLNDALSKICPFCKRPMIVHKKGDSFLGVEVRICNRTDSKLMVIMSGSDAVYLEGVY
jgi:hypothetical protein